MKVTITHPKITAYLDALCPRDAVTRRMERWASDHDFPIVGPQAGRFLAQLVMLTGARRVVELGSGYGYSAYWMARSGPADLRIDCTDLDPDNIQRARKYLGRTPAWKKIRYFRLDGIDHLRTVKRASVDLIFMDIDKARYPDAVPIIVQKLKKGGLLVTDNVLWSGRVLAPSRDPHTAGVRKFTKMIFSHPSLYTHIVPIRDGLSVSIRL
jgi:predicted O-methyltransferase YrrM